MNLLSCFRKQTANETFFDHCMYLMGREAEYNENECALFAYRIVVLANSDIPFDPVKADGLLARLHATHGRKIYSDARDAILFVKGGRVGERRIPTPIYASMGSVALIAEWRQLVD